jgi:RimJ/RimL family protein N-acetyltransferase
MALIKPVEFVSKKDKRILIRNFETGDAEKMLRAFIKIAETSPYIISTADQVRKMSVAEEEKFISSHNESERKLLVGAFFENQIVGIFNFFSYSDSKRFHRGSLGTSLHPDFRNEGIAKKLMEVGIQFVRTLPRFEFLELEVMDRNIPALELYKKLGFKTLHSTPEASILEDGSRVTEMKMRLEIHP